MPNSPDEHADKVLALLKEFAGKVNDLLNRARLDARSLKLLLINQQFKPDRFRSDVLSDSRTDAARRVRPCSGKASQLVDRGAIDVDRKLELRLPGRRARRAHKCVQHRSKYAMKLGFGQWRGLIARGAAGRQCWALTSALKIAVQRLHELPRLFRIIGLGAMAEASALASPTPAWPTSNRSRIPSALPLAPPLD